MTRIFATILTVALLAAQAFAGGVTLKRAARLAEDQTLTLADIARLTDDADRALRGVPVPVDFDGVSVVRLTLEDVRAAMKASGHEPSRYAINGAECAVRLIRAEVQDAPAPVLEPLAPTWSAPSDERSFHARILRTLTELYGVDPEDFRVTWQERDHGFLDRTDGNIRLVLEPISTGDADRAAMIVRLWRDDAIIETRTIRADIQIRRTSYITTRELRRGDIVSRDDLRAERDFGTPGGAELVSSIDEAAGMLVKKTIREGVALQREHLEPPVLVERGQAVTLYCMRGSIEIRTTVRSKEDGVFGQLIEVQKPGSRETMFAKVDGPARVTVSDRTSTDPLKGISQ